MEYWVKIVKMFWTLSQKLKRKKLRGALTPSQSSLIKSFLLKYIMDFSRSLFSSKKFHHSRLT